MHVRHIIRLFKPLSFVALLAVFCAGCSKGEKLPDAGALPEVSVATVVSKPVYQWDEFTGRIAAIDTVELRPRVSGYIDRIAFKEGDEVKAGDLLFVIDPRPYRIALDSAQAQLERARSSARYAQFQEKRAQPLIEDQAISREEYDQRTTNLTQSNADVRAAEAAVANARLNLDFTQVRSPIAGRIGRALLTIGNLAQADESVLTTVVSQDPVYVYFQPDEQTYLRYAELARKGERPGSANPVRVGLAGDTAYLYTGTVDFVSNQVDPATGTISARAVVPNPDRVFTPGLYARVQLQGSGEFSAILIDDKAIMTDQDRKYVYVLGLENKAMRKDVTLGRVIDGLRIIKSGLEPNDKVIVAGLQKILFPGASVKPNEVPMAAPPAAARTR